MDYDVKYPEEIKLEAVLRRMRAEYCANCVKSDLFCRDFCACRPEKAYPTLNQLEIVGNSASHAVAKISQGAVIA